MNPISIEEYLQSIEENNKNTKDACIRYINEFNNSTSSLEQFMQLIIQSLNVHDYLLKKLSENNLQLQNQVNGLKKELSELKQTTIPNSGASSSLGIPPHINNPQPQSAAQPNAFASYSPQVNSPNQHLLPESKPLPTSQVPIQPISPGKPIMPSQPGFGQYVQPKPISPQQQPMQPINPGKPIMPSQPISPGKPIMPSQPGFGQYVQPNPIFPQQQPIQPINPGNPIMPSQPGFGLYGQPKPISPQSGVPMKPSYSIEPTSNNTNA
ncbi:hypothetical protein EHI8A_048660 [Entamoeba histolytica HM-1:IMSS-B]|uniref:Uncharacterized protein n=4 Tax=Entamoeba histolytica TaxID=5759 RepID=C4M7T3_ENTH1|nr:hypothetical protein EHI_114770 [Entamoeba histolytica HM-1:IMSS]EAL44936.1 hypothetical protein EHI_114770 [Entamoeba histolytica HM-1:IMSS]EMH78228.1 hypothetical protein EHI8A_048660 [Entamoeba histolytica HM-1:IMSS-B]ENY65629.1 hypothetical protein EHI7A_042400 [Entamoeba histolytica HM-1:IMSS-A]GAT97608.1 hypothetical protein CL6EHI_114770 [Entamoeba histolytica]|eukprot:XP_650322.1 hypothetical protein EHI_114770 [Entamoeba histolytica HM-1:IMSS]